MYPASSRVETQLITHRTKPLNSEVPETCELIWYLLVPVPSLSVWNPPLRESQENLTIVEALVPCPFFTILRCQTSLLGTMSDSLNSEFFLPDNSITSSA